MVRTGCRIVIGGVAASAGIRRTVVVPVVAGSAIVRDGGMRPVQGIVIKVRGMASGTLGRRIHIPACMTVFTVG